MRAHTHKHARSHAHVSDTFYVLCDTCARESTHAENINANTHAHDRRSMLISCLISPASEMFATIQVLKDVCSVSPVRDMENLKQ